MRTLYFTAFLLGILLLPISVLSQPTIHSIDFSPSNNLWVGESLGIQINCTDQNQTVTGVYATVIGKDGYTIPNKTFYFQSGLYTGTIDPVYLNRENEFLLNVSCVNDISEKTFSTRNFTVSNFTSNIVSIYPNPIYMNDKIEIDVSVRKNNIPIVPPENVSFLITINDVPKIPTSIPYDPGKGWVVYLDSPGSTGTYNLKIITIYGRVNVTSTSSFSISEPVQFSITNIDKTWVKNNDTINLQIQAFDRGSKISLNSGNLAIQVGSTYATITAITPVSNYYTVSLLTPSQSGGEYPLTATLSYNGYTYTASRTVYYTTAISGKILDLDNNGVSTEIRFYSGNVLKLRIYTDSNGAYSGSIPPGTYDVEVIFPDATLYLYGVDAGSFSDPIKYFYFPSVDVPGLNIAGLHVFEVASSFERAYMEMKYDESKVVNENLLEVYKCINWSTGKKICNGYWEEMSFKPDTIRNMMAVNTTSFSAYAIGNIKTLSIDFNLNKEKYSLKDLMKLRGQTIDEYKNPVPNAKVTAYIKGTGINMDTTSDNNGLFNFEFLSPETEGIYTLVLSAEKNPYVSFKSDKIIELVRSKDISIVFPDTLKIKEGENLDQELRIVNIGQSDLHGLNISLTGIPEQYYTIIGPSIEKIGSGETKSVSISFHVPFNVSLGTSSSTLKASNGEVSKEKIFGFTILSNNQTQVENESSSITGWFSKISLPKIDLRIIYVTIFAALCFSLAFVLKKRKAKSEKRDEIKGLLSDVKNHINKKEPSFLPSTTEKPQDQNTDSLSEESNDKSSYSDGVGM